VYANGSGFSALAKGALRLAVALIVGGAALNKWVGGVLASNGKIYAIPRSSSSTILVIDTRSVGTLCTPVLESAYFNKY
jgi:hypothetical protein